MADYPIIADVSAHIVRTLRKKMCPEPIPSPNNIEISSPADQDVDYILGLYLYDIREERDGSSYKSRPDHTVFTIWSLSTALPRWD